MYKILFNLFFLGCVVTLPTVYSMCFVGSVACYGLLGDRIGPGRKSDTPENTIKSRKESVLTNNAESEGVPYFLIRLNCI